MSDSPELVLRVLVSECSEFWFDTQPDDWWCFITDNYFQQLKINQVAGEQVI